MQTVLYTTFDVTGLLVPGAVNHVGALLGTYKWGYTDQWVNMTAVGGPDGARVLILRLVVRQSCNLAILQSYNLEASVLRGGNRISQPVFPPLCSSFELHAWGGIPGRWSTKHAHAMPMPIVC